MRCKWYWLGWVLVLVSCGQLPETAVTPTQVPTAVIPRQTISETAVVVSPEPAITAIPLPTTPARNRRVEQEPVLVPKLIPFDGIAPVYDPQFASVENAPLQDDELVMGMAWGGEAKAYPVTVMRFREIVNDEMAGIPTLVTW